MVPKTEKWSREESLKKSMGGTGGYIITKQGAHKLLLFIQNEGMTNGIDTMMQKAANKVSTYYCTPHLIFSECFRPENMQTVDTDIQRNFDSMGRTVEERVEVECMVFKEHQIPYRIVDEYEADDDNILIVNRGFEKLHNVFSYYIGDTIKVAVPLPFLGKYPYLTNYGLIENGRFSTKNLISYK
jgi:hypothetical protein